jgi:hypothetical protein
VEDWNREVRGEIKGTGETGELGLVSLADGPRERFLFGLRIKGA